MTASIADLLFPVLYHAGLQRLFELLIITRIIFIMHKLQKNPNMSAIP